MHKDDRWVAKNLAKLVDLYGGRYVAVVDGRVVASGARPEKVEDLARRGTGVDVPSVIRVPKKDQIGIIY
ncbi:MAG: DUF5678 domain-containing protein [Elusimicrobiota bacterium]|jgi:hypothetical protein